jgi:phosphomannomutase
MDRISGRIMDHFGSNVASTEDGIYLQWPDSWAHVRASNTEPIMRVIVEAPSQNQADSLLESLTALVHV